MFSLRFNLNKIKSENTQALRRAGIEVIDSLPALDDADVRSADAVAKRLIAMAALLQLHFKAPVSFIEEYLDENGLLEVLSSHEREVLRVGYDSLNERHRTDLYWTIEAIWALAWAGQKHDVLSLNTCVENKLASMLPNFAKKEAAHDFIASYRLRSKKELFSKLDLLYRAHWYARSRSLQGESNTLVDLDIVIERRKALEWVCNSSLAWDEISLDT